MDKRDRDEFSKAIGRIGKGGNHATWLLDFARKNLRSLSDGDWLNVRYEATAFAELGSEAQSAEEHLRHPILTRAQTEVMSREDVRNAQELTKKFLKQVVERRTLSVQFPPMTKHLEPGDHHPWAEWVTTEDPMTPFTHSLYDVLKRYGYQIRLCPAPDCAQGFFLGDRQNQRFCSSVCQTREATRSYRERHQLVTGRKRGRPRKEEQATTKTTPTKRTSIKGGTDGISRRDRRS